MSGDVLIIEGGRVLDPAGGRDEKGDVIVADGLIVADVPAQARTIRRYDADGLWVVPGLLDLHVHFREPGGEASETLASGAATAARSGFTRVVTMPNTRPPMDDPALIRQHLAASAHLPVDILPSACCTSRRAGGEIADLAALKAAGASAFTDDGSMVADDAVMLQVMQTAAALDMVVMEHAVVPELAGAGVVRDSPVARSAGLPVFPPEAEVEAVARDIRLVRQTGCRLHIQHLSCAGAIDLIRAARREGLPVSAEVTPHHLMLAAEDIPADDANWKMNPPLGTRADVAALRVAVAEGVITCCATDHAPHAAPLKAGGFRGTMFGVLGLETAIGASLRALVVETGISPLVWVATWTTAPAAIIGLTPPSLRPGTRADICLIRPGTWTFGAEDIFSKSRNTPFIGQRLEGRCVATLRAGRFYASR